MPEMSQLISEAATLFAFASPALAAAVTSLFVASFGIDGAGNEVTHRGGRRRRHRR